MAEDTEGKFDLTPTRSTEFLLTPIDPVVEIPCEIIPGHFLAKADPELEKRIIELVQRCSPEPFAHALYTCDFEFNEEGTGYTSRQAEGDEKIYWVISTDGNNMSFHDLEMAFSLLDKSLHLGFSFLEYKGGTGHGSNASHVFNFYDSLCYNFERMKPIRFDESALKFVQETYGKLKSENQAESVKHAFRLYRSLHTVSYKSALYSLGLFSLVECCLTHNPRGSEDSLSHQIRTKFSLVRKRFCRPLNISDWFGELSEKKVWTELYAYRSAIAHGTKYQFEETFSKLGCKEEKAKEFLEEVSKLLLITCLDESDLMLDLKQC